jgi:hypothetical protein
MAHCKTVNCMLDRLVTPEIELMGRTRSVFRVCGYAGLALAVALTAALVASRGLSIPLMLGIVAVAVLTFLTLAMASKIAKGFETLTYYHHQFAVMATTAALLWLLRQPILPYLEITVLGVGAFLGSGRVGCLMVGCCHGKPHRWGVRYGEEHAATGFPSHFVGVRLLPVQLIESLSVFCIVALGSGLVWTGRRPGETLAWYLAAYAVLRFALEFWRGDEARPYFGGFSEAQWTSLAVASAALAASLADLVPFRWWQVAAAAALGLAIVVVAIGRRVRRTDSHRLLQARHVGEIAQALERLARSEHAPADAVEPAQALRPVPVARTSLGLLISAGRVRDEGGLLRHYALSQEGGSLDEDVGFLLARLVVRLARHSASAQLIKGSNGVFHALVRA